MFIKEIIKYSKNFPREKKGHIGAVEFLKKIPSNTYNTLGITMTFENKVGINPRTIHKNGPIGIYFYPINYYIDTIKNQEELPYVHNANYIQIIKLPLPITILQKMTEKECLDQLKFLSRTLDRMLGVIDAYNNQPNVNQINSFNELIDYNREKYLGFKPSVRPGILWWENTHKLAKSVENILNSKIEVILNWMFRTMHHNTIVDYGDGIIHDGESAQGIILNTSQVTLLKTISNDIENNYNRDEYLLAKDIDYTNDNM